MVVRNVLGGDVFFPLVCVMSSQRFLSGFSVGSAAAKRNLLGIAIESTPWDRQMAEKAQRRLTVDSAVPASCMLNQTALISFSRHDGVQA